MNKHFWVAALAPLAALSLPSAYGAGDATTIEELRRIIEQQQRQLDAQAKTLEALQRQVETLKPAAEIEPVPAPAPAAPVVESGEERVKLSLSGQVNRGLLFIDDGEKTEIFNVDNDNSSTRIRLIGEAEPSDELSIGTNIEVQFESNSTAAVNQEDQRNVGPNNFTERKLELYFDHARYGRLTLGQGDTASNGSAEVDLSGTSVIGYSSIADLAGGILFRNEDTGELSEVKIGDVFDNLDGLSRDDRVRYDSPSFGGLQFATSYIADDRWDAAVRYGGEFGAFKTAAAVAYADPNTAGWDNRVSGSFSVLHTSGVNLTAAAGRDERADRDPEFWYVKLGYIADLVSWGDTAFAIDYYRGDDMDTAGDEAKAYGAFVVQALADYGTELYLGLRQHELDRPGANVDEIFAALAGARVKF